MIDEQDKTAVLYSLGVALDGMESVTVLGSRKQKFCVESGSAGFVCSICSRDGTGYSSAPKDTAQAAILDAHRRWIAAERTAAAVLDARVRAAEDRTAAVCGRDPLPSEQAEIPQAESEPDVAAQRAKNIKDIGRRV